MAKNQTPYGSSAKSNKARGILAATDFSNNTTGRPSTAITKSLISETVMLRQRGMYQMYYDSIVKILRDNGATTAKIHREGNTFDLVATFPEVDNAELALRAIHGITQLHRK